MSNITMWLKLITGVTKVIDHIMIARKEDEDARRLRIKRKVLVKHLKYREKALVSARKWSRIASKALSDRDERREKQASSMRMRYAEEASEHLKKIQIIKKEIEVLEDIMEGKR